MDSKMEYFPDGTQIDSWFYDTRVPELTELGTQYIVLVFAHPYLCTLGSTPFSARTISTT